MTSAEKVQEYLKRHKIGVLFEDLMAKVIADMPDDPVIYLARILHLRAEKRGARSLKTSTHFDNVAVAKKSIDKPWSTNSKRLKDIDPKTGKKLSRPEWNQRTKHVTSSFDDLWDEPKAGRKSQPGSPTKMATAPAWADPNIDDGEDVMFSVYGYRGPHRSFREAGDPLAEELKLVKDKTEPKETKKFSPVSKKSGPRADSSRHKRELQQYIRECEQKSDSGIEEDRDLQSDDAVELLEDLDELRREGVKNVKQSGVKVNRTQQPSRQAAVRVSICARCAKVMGAGVPSEPAPGVAFTEITDYDYDTVKDTGLSSHFHTAISDDDEEFESVSQVTGPRRPVWQDSDNEGVTPRRNKTVLPVSMSPSKSLPVYSSEKPSRGQKSAGTPVAKSSQFHEHNVQDLVNNPLRMTWSPAAVFNSTDSEDDDYTNQTARSQTARSGSGAWQVPPDYDTDSSFYGSPGARKPVRLDRAY